MAAPQIIVKLTSAGVDSGPCDLYSNTDGYVTPIATGIAIATLTGAFGYYVNAPIGITTIRIQNSGNCSNYVDTIIT